MYKDVEGRFAIFFFIFLKGIIMYTFLVEK